MAISISELQRLRAPLAGEGGLSLPRPADLDIGRGDPGEFGDMLKNALDPVDGVQKAGPYTQHTLPTKTKR